MTFNREDELFPTVNVDDAPVKEEVNVSSEVAEAARDAKRKSPEKPAEKKVFFVVVLFISISYVALHFVSLPGFISYNTSILCSCSVLLVSVLNVVRCHHYVAVPFLWTVRWCFCLVVNDSYCFILWFIVWIIFSF